MSANARLALAFSFSLFLAACGGDNGNKTADDGPSILDPVYSLGSGSGSSFAQGALEIANSALRDGESTLVTASVADRNGNLYTGAASVSFRSNCIDSGLATIDTPVDISGGFATTTYTSQGCSGDDSITASATVEDNSSTASGAVSVRAAYRLGSGAGADFQPGALDIGVDTLSAGGSTAVSVSIADDDGNLFDSSVTVNFASDCAASGLSLIDTGVASVNGVATANYTAQGCVGDDSITASAIVDGATSSASGSVEVLAPVIGSLQFVSAEPNDIGIRGFGLIEVSKVTFRVLDTNGSPVNAELVNFELNTTVGGISISDTSAASNIDGDVSVDVQSGTVATTARVTATVAASPSIKTQSDGLVVSTGIADQDSISLSLSELNPEAWQLDGVEVSVTVHAADHFNNPVPDGTAIAFNTEGGQIQPQCQTTNGRCSLNWTSSNPRPLDGRVTILATMIGEESFLDTNGNGVLDDMDTFIDVSEAFRDDNESGEFDQGIEEFLDFNTNDMFDIPDEAYNGVLCCDADAVAGAEEGDACFGRTPAVAACSVSRNIHVRDQIVLVMAYSFLEVEPGKPVLNGFGESTDSTTVAIYGLHPDGSQQTPPVGTSIGVSTTNGSLQSETSFSVPNTNAPGPYVIDVIWKGDSAPSTGFVRITATSPDGAVSSASIVAND